MLLLKISGTIPGYWVLSLQAVPDSEGRCQWNQESRGCWPQLGCDIERRSPTVDIVVSSSTLAFLHLQRHWRSRTWEKLRCSTLIFDTAFSLNLNCCEQFHTGFTGSSSAKTPPRRCAISFGSFVLPDGFCHDYRRTLPSIHLPGIWSGCLCVKNFQMIILWCQKL